MEIDIINKKENKALDRTEVKFDCIYTGEATPKLLAVKSKLVSLLNTKKDLIVVDSLQPHYGEAKAAGYAKIYGSRDSLEDIETEHVLAKNKEAKSEKTETEETAEEEVEVVEETTEEEVESTDDEESKDDDDSEESADDESEESEESE